MEYSPMYYEYIKCEMLYIHPVCCLILRSSAVLADCGNTSHFWQKLCPEKLTFMTPEINLHFCSHHYVAKSVKKFNM